MWTNLLLSLDPLPVAPCSIVRLLVVHGIVVEPNSCDRCGSAAKQRIRVICFSTPTSRRLLEVKRSCVRRSWSVYA